jgi:hypothetical protein
LKNCKPVLFIEINQNIKEADLKTLNLLELLKNNGYELYIKVDGQLKAWKGEKKVNYYFLTKAQWQMVHA